MRAVSLALAMGALLFGSGVFANETVHQERSDISEAPSHVLQRRTFGHGSYSYCSDKRYKLAFHSGSGSCSCVSSCGSKQKECPDPRSGKGYGACSGKGCTIICNDGFELSNGDCKAIPPKCKENEIISNGKCVCPSGFEVKKGACVKIPTCKEFEKWNGKSCECAPSCGRHKKTNQCEPQCPINSWYDGKAGECKCDYKFIKVNGQCKPDCGSDKEWCDDSHKCICKPGFVDIWGTCKPVPTCPIGQSYDKISKSCKCPEGTQLVSKWCKPIVPSCPKNEVYDFKTKSCICIPSCKRGHKNTCEPVTPPPVGPSQKPKPKPGHGHWAQDLHKAIWDSRHHRREQDAEFCPDGLSACPISQTLGGGYECLDTTEELENCGGCTANGDGVDCTAIPNASGVGCQAGRCVVFSCAANFRLSPAGECTPSLFFSSA